MSCNSEKKTNSEVISDTITEKYWKLKSLNSREINMVENQTCETFFILKSKDNRLKGFAGCNTFGGTFILEKRNTIRFTNVLSTLMACPDITINETEFLKNFNLTGNYTIKDDVLSLSIGKRAPLAVFEVVYTN